MTCHKTTTLSTDTVAVPQSNGDDPFGLNNIPGFLRRTPKLAEPARAGRDK